MTASTVGTVAMVENNATSRTWSRPSPPVPDFATRLLAMRRPSSMINATQGPRLTTSNKATSGGVSNRCGAAPARTTK